LTIHLLLFLRVLKANYNGVTTKVGKMIKKISIKYNFCIKGEFFKSEKILKCETFQDLTKQKFWIRI
jgi:hypothetical protein